MKILHKTCLISFMKRISKQQSWGEIESFFTIFSNYSSTDLGPACIWRNEKQINEKKKSHTIACHIFCPHSYFSPSPSLRMDWKTETSSIHLDDCGLLSLFWAKLSEGKGEIYEGHMHLTSNTCYFCFVNWFSIFIRVWGNKVIYLLWINPCIDIQFTFSGSLNI